MEFAIAEFRSKTFINVRNTQSFISESMLIVQRLKANWWRVAFRQARSRFCHLAYWRLSLHLSDTKPESKVFSPLKSLRDFFRFFVYFRAIRYSGFSGSTWKQCKKCSRKVSAVSSSVKNDKSLRKRLASKTTWAVHVAMQACWSRSLVISWHRRLCSTSRSTVS